MSDERTRSQIVVNNTSTSEEPCAGKLVFETPEAAEATGTVSEWRYGGKLKVYRCRYCHLYHLSSNSPD